MSEHRILPPAFVASLVAHAAFFVALGMAPASPPTHPAENTTIEPVDIWAGTTSELPVTTNRVYEVDVDTQNASNPSETPPIQKEPSPQPIQKAPSPQPSTPSNQTQPKPNQGKPSSVPPPSPSPSNKHPIPDSNKNSSLASRPVEPAQGASTSSGDDANTGQGNGEFGAEGRGAVRSLGRAFTRAIPPACQGDEGWKSLPIGDAGTIRVIVDIDETGHLAGYRADVEHPPKHLENLVKRTMILLQSGVFAVQNGSVTAGKQTIEIGATVSDVAVPEETQTAIDLAWRFDNGQGKASFTQPSGRHVEIRLRVVRTEVSAASHQAEP